MFDAKFRVILFYKYFVKIHEITLLYYFIRLTIINPHKIEFRTRILFYNKSTQTSKFLIQT